MRHDFKCQRENEINACDKLLFLFRRSKGGYRNSSNADVPSTPVTPTMDWLHRKSNFYFFNWIISPIDVVQMTGKRGKNFFGLWVLLPLFWVTITSDSPPLQSPTNQVNAPVGTLVNPELIRAKQSVQYDFKPIQTAIRLHRLQLAACFMSSPHVSTGSIQLTLNWEPLGLLHHVKLVPDPGEETIQCVASLVRTWQLKPHPKLQSFSYTVRLVPMGL